MEVRAVGVYRVEDWRIEVEDIELKMGRLERESFMML